MKRVRLTTYDTPARFPVRDVGGGPPRMTERQSDEGNARYIASVKPGSYALRTKGDVVELLDEDGNVVMMLPGGDVEYESRDDQYATHIYQRAKGEADLKPLMAKDANPRVAERVANVSRVDRGRRITMSADTMRAKIADLNRRNRAHYRGGTR